jgi:hypothetical protein
MDSFQFRARRRSAQHGGRPAPLRDYFDSREIAVQTGPT